MGDHRHGLRSTTSLCPTCLEPVPGRYEERDGAVHLTRSCPDHGAASPKVWGSVDHWEWAADFGPEPDPGGDLTVENSHACLAVVEVTQGCNLSCPYCFASSGPGGRQLPFEDVVELLEVVREGGGPRPVQFSGGEPTHVGTPLGTTPGPPVGSISRMPPGRGPPRASARSHVPAVGRRPSLRGTPERTDPASRPGSGSLDVEPARRGRRGS